MQTLRQNILSGLKAMFLLPVPLETVRGDLMALWAALFLLFLSYLGLSLYYIDGYDGINWYGFELMGLMLAMLLAGRLLMQGSAQEADQADRLSVLFVNAYALMIAFESPLYYLLADYFGNTDETYGQWMIFFGLWIFCVTLRQMLAGLKTDLFRKFLVPAALSVMLTLPHWHFGTPWLFYEADQEEETEENDTVYLQDEKVFLAQENLIKKALTEIKSSKAGEIDFFVVAAGPYGHQRVFTREARMAKKTLAQIFHAKERAIDLTNHTDTALETPIASFTNLQKVMRDLKTKAQEEDVLILYLASHGGDEKLSVKLRGLQLLDLSAERINELLQESGFKWRILVISACYSGSFIPTLKNEQTMIITAASEDRTSYGCSDEAELTFFGKAFLRQGFQGTQNIIHAFTAAKKWIEKEEQADDFWSSYPQIYVGIELCSYLRGQKYLEGTTEEECAANLFNPYFIGVPQIDRIVVPFLDKAAEHMDNKTKQEKDSE